VFHVSTQYYLVNFFKMFLPYYPYLLVSQLSGSWVSTAFHCSFSYHLCYKHRHLKKKQWKNGVLHSLSLYVQPEKGSFSPSEKDKIMYCSLCFCSVRSRTDDFQITCISPCSSYPQTDIPVSWNQLRLFFRVSQSLYQTRWFLGFSLQQTYRFNAPFNKYMHFAYFLV